MMIQNIETWMRERDARNEDFERRNGMYRNRRRTKSAAGCSKSMESLSYEPDDSEIYKKYRRQKNANNGSSLFSFSRRLDMRRWFITFVVGAGCAVVAVFVAKGTYFVMQTKLSVFHNLIEQEKRGEIVYGCAFTFYLITNLVFGYVAWFTVFLEPLAAGSGIPEVKCFLNGLSIPGVVRIETLWCKVIGIIFSVSSGLPLGKEGPMVHAGSILGAYTSQRRCFSTKDSPNDFRNDKEKRDFVANGTAAGLAAAFGAPIGGVLFALEEGSSYWSTSLMWRCFFCAMSTGFLIIMINSYGAKLGDDAMFNFGEFHKFSGEKSNFFAWEMFLFVVVGCCGGIIGALFVTANKYLTRFRMAYVHTTKSKFAEVLFVVGLTSVVAFFLSYTVSFCTPLKEFQHTAVYTENTEQEKYLMSKLVPLYCPTGTHYNELASLFLVDGDTAIKQLFHFREMGNAKDETFNSSTLFIFFSSYVTMACIVSGILVPAGIFVPSLLSGAAFGRFFGHVLHNLDYSRGSFADAGTYSLMGAAACTAGITRITISLAIMILEATGDMQYVMPLMVTVMSARLVGNLFSDGIYDMKTALYQFPFLKQEELVCNKPHMYALTVKDVMTGQPVTLRSIMKVGHVLDVMCDNNHHCFPIVDEDQVFIGTLSRKVICTLMYMQSYDVPVEDRLESRRTSSDRPSSGEAVPLISWNTIESCYPDYPDVSNILSGAIEREAILDFQPYIDFAAYSLNEHSTFQRAYKMLRTLGLRQLVITDKHNLVRGIVTRIDLADATRTHARLKSSTSSEELEQQDGYQMLPLIGGDS